MKSDGLEKGALVEAQIEKGVFRGRGLARIDGRVVFVPRAHPGDLVRARISEVHAGWAEGELVEVLQASPERRDSPCPYVRRCGGCAYQDYDSQAELRLKEAVLRESLARSGAAWDGSISLHASPEAGWRMRASLHVALEGSERSGIHSRVAEGGVRGMRRSTPRNEGSLRLGLRQEGSRRVVDLERCLQLSEPMNRAARAFHSLLAGRPDVAARVHGLDLVESPDGRSLVATLETRLDRSEAPQLASFGSAVPGLTGFGVRSGTRSLEWLSGSPFVEATVLGVALRAHALAFFQANRFLLEPLASTVVGLVPRGDSRILDLYAGVGLFALPLAARDACEVVAVEHSTLATEDARFSAERAGLHVRLRASDVERALAEIEPRAGERIVIDPPRTGAGRAVVEAIARRKPETVVYVSCDPPTLGRDLALFAAHGYRPDTVELFDQFPKTFHVEAVVRLRA